MTVPATAPSWGRPRATHRLQPIPEKRTCLSRTWNESVTTAELPLDASDVEVGSIAARAARDDER